MGIVRDTWRAVLFLIVGVLGCMAERLKSQLLEAGTHP